ncbi:MAG: 3'-5' exonuclease, partial [Candidatus Pacebacteria bacterium]|nr:3'-5' exonuclease [Candidatus Paceibacterota bacterium]
MKKINFLPTKIKYNSYSKNIEMFYRKKNSNNLFKTKVPYDHYIFVDSSYRTYGEIDTTYTLLGTNNELIKIYIDPSDAREIYNMGRYITAEGDVSPEQRFACDSFYNIEFPKDINPRIFLLDIEAYVVDSLMPSFSHNIAPINAITIYDTYTKKYYCWFCPKEKVDIIEEEKKIRELYSKYDDTEIEINIFLNYKDLLNSFMIFMSKNTPDIISAWNSKFDLPYIARKIFDEFGLDGLKFISPFNTVSFSLRKALDDNLDFEYDNVFPGIDVIDMLEMYKKHTPGDRPSFSLKAISEEELDESKLIFEEEGSDPAEMYEKDFTFFCM